jgi:hypothetical protein
MIDHATFSALRLRRIFPREHPEGYRYYIEIDPDGNFDTEYMGGQWHEELIDGVQFFYPQRDGNKLGIVELWGSGCVIAAAVRDRPAAISASLIPSWMANVNRVLEALDLPIRMGSDEAAVRALAAGKVRSSGFPDEWYSLYPAVAKDTLRSLAFACRAPDIYHLNAVVHCTEGLLKLQIYQPDLIRSNDHEGGYDDFFAGLYDEGPG